MVASAALLLVATYAGCGAGTLAQVRTLAPGVLRIGTYFVNPPFEHLLNGDEIGVEVATTRADPHTPGLRVIGHVPDDPQPLGIGFNKAIPNSPPRSIPSR